MAAAAVSRRRSRTVCCCCCRFSPPSPLLCTRLFVRSLPFSSLPCHSFFFFNFFIFPFCSTNHHLLLLLYQFSHPFIPFNQPGDIHHHLRSFSLSDYRFVNSKSPNNLFHVDQSTIIHALSSSYLLVLPVLILGERKAHNHFF